MVQFPHIILQSEWLIAYRGKILEEHRALIGLAEPHQARHSGEVIGVGYR